MVCPQQVHYHYYAILSYRSVASLHTAIYRKGLGLDLHFGIHNKLGLQISLQHYRLNIFLSVH